MNGEYRLELIFMRESREKEPLQIIIEEQLEHLFEGAVRWHLVSRKEEGNDFVVAEVEGTTDVTTPGDLMARMKNRSHPAFWETLYGYRVQLMLEEAREYVPVLLR